MGNQPPQFVADAQEDDEMWQKGGKDVEDGGSDDEKGKKKGKKVNELRAALIDVGKRSPLNMGGPVQSGKKKDDGAKRISFKNSYFEVRERDVILPTTGEVVDTITSVVIRDQGLAGTISAYDVFIEGQDTHVGLLGGVTVYNIYSGASLAMRYAQLK